jgi:protein-S-isoprenylcysteine O-methyltransferase Ste14
MTHEFLLRLLGYFWIAFGAYWIVIVRRSPSPDARHPWLRPVVLAMGLGLLLYLDSRVPPLLLIPLVLLWALTGLFWDRVGEKQESSEHGTLRLLRLCILAVTFALLFWNKTAVGFLGHRFVPALSGFAEAGSVLATVGLLLAVWARVHLSIYWSDKVVLQTNHLLIRSGPYAYLRHPIYSGVLLAVLGTALVVGEWRGAVAFAILLTNYVIKAGREERILAQRFGAEFQDHVGRTGFLWPRLRLR